MKHKILCTSIWFMLLISFSAYAIQFTPETTYGSVVVVYTETGVGSGFFISENRIITNAHVVGNSKAVTIDLYSGLKVPGTVIKTDPNIDLALISVDTTAAPLPVSSDKLNIGQEVYAIGAPRDMPYTMTKGIISALDRKIGQNTYIQIDASVNSGNSGGPLLDENGKVIGIITLKASDAEGIGFAIQPGDIQAFMKDAESLSPLPSSETENITPDREKDEKNDLQQRLMSENDSLKTALCVSVALNVIFVLFHISRMIKKRSEKEKVDFEIEIEE